MATLTLDTYRAMQRLTASGIPEDQAEAILGTLQEVNLDRIVTQQDLKCEIAELKAELLKWLVPLLVGQVAAFTTIVVGLFAVLGR